MVSHLVASTHGEFWLGNDNLHRLTGNVTMRVDLEDFEGDIRYTTFKVADEADKYRLLITG